MIETQLDRYISVFEHLPDDGLYRIVYSEVWRRYSIAKFSPVAGWMALTSKNVVTVTHWLERPISMPFEQVNALDEEAAKKYNLEGCFEDD